MSFAKRIVGVFNYLNAGERTDLATKNQS